MYVGRIWRWLATRGWARRCSAALALVLSYEWRITSVDLAEIPNRKGHVDHEARHYRWIDSALLVSHLHSGMHVLTMAFAGSPRPLYSKKHYRLRQCQPFSYSSMYIVTLGRNQQQQLVSKDGKTPLLNGRFSDAHWRLNIPD